MGRKETNGLLELFRPLPLVAGDPDTLNHVVCGRTDALGSFRVEAPTSLP